LIIGDMDEIIFMVYSTVMAKREATNTKNKTSRSHKTAKRTAIKMERLAALKAKRKKK
jgi:hypothetical protein